MKKKINIRYLLQGSIEFEVDEEKLKNKTQQELQDWATNIMLESVSNDKLIAGTCHFDPNYVKETGDKYDCAPLAECIELHPDYDTDHIMETHTWDVFKRDGSHRFM